MDITTHSCALPKPHELQAYGDMVRCKICDTYYMLDKDLKWMEVPK